MGKREGQSIGGFSALGAAFEGQELPIAPEPRPAEEDPIPNSADTAGDPIIFENHRYIFDGYDADGMARLEDYYSGDMNVPPTIKLVTREQLLEGFRLAKEDEAAEERRAIEGGERAEREAAARMAQDIEHGIAPSLAVDNEIARDEVAVQAAVDVAEAVPALASDESMTTPPGMEPVPPQPEGELSVDDQPERAKWLNVAITRLIEVEGQLRALKNKNGQKRKVGELYLKRDKLDEEIHGVLNEVAPEVLKSIRVDDYAHIENMRELFGSERDIVARKEKEQALIAEGKITQDDLDAYKAALAKRSEFISSMKKIGVPHHVATRLFRNEVDELRALEQVIARADVRDAKVLDTRQAKHLLSRFGVKDEKIEWYKEVMRKKIEANEPLAPDEFSSFVSRGQERPVVPAAPDVLSATEASAQHSDTSGNESALVTNASEDIDREIARLEYKLKNTGFSSLTEMRAAKTRLEELKQDKATLVGRNKPTASKKDDSASPEVKREDIAGVLAEEQEVKETIARDRQLQDEAELIIKLEEEIAGLTGGNRKEYFENVLRGLTDAHEAFSRDKKARLSDGPLAQLKKLSGEIVALREEGAALSERNPISLHVLEAFSKEGVEYADLEAIPGFVGLSEGQQLLMLKNYSTAVVNKVKREAKSESDAAWSERTFLGKLGLSMLTLGLAKNISEQARQRDIARKLSSGEKLVKEERRVMLEAFAKIAIEGPEVERSADGALHTHYLATERFKDDKEALEAVNAYNRVAEKFAKLPKQWIDADLALPRNEQQSYFSKLLGKKHMMLSGKEHLEVAETKEEYQESRKRLLAVLEKHNDKEPGVEARRSAMLEMNALDERVQLDQLFASNPDAEEALQDIRDTNVFTRALSEFGKHRGQYIAYGAATRFVATAVVGAIAIPGTMAIAGGAVAVGVAGAVGYFQARREAKELLKTRRASGLLSDEDLREDVAYTVNNSEILGRKEEAHAAALEKGDQELANLIKQDIDILRGKVKSGSVIERRIKQLKEFKDAKFYTDRIERLLTKLDVANDMGDKAAAETIERKIAQTATLMRELMKQGMLSFGAESRLARVHTRLDGGPQKDRHDDADVAINSLAFMQALGHADAVHSLDMSAIEEKLEKTLGGYREDIDAAARKRSTKHVAKAVALRAGFGLAGYGLARAGMQFFGGHGEQVTQHAHGATHGQPHQWALPKTPAPKTHTWALPETPRPPVASIEHGGLALGVHTVAHGETLTAIARKFPEIAKLSGHDQEVAIANLVKHLSPEKLKLLGISSGNPNLIRTGEHIDLTKLHEEFVSLKTSGAQVAAHADKVIHHEVAPRAGGQVVHEDMGAEKEAQEAAHAPMRIPARGRVNLPPGSRHDGVDESMPHPRHKGGFTLPPPVPGQEIPHFGSPMEAAAVVQNKMDHALKSIFGQKGLFGRDHTREWEGDPLSRVHGLKDAPAQRMLEHRSGLLAESRTRMGLRNYMQELHGRTHIEPRTGETTEMYIRRALLSEEGGVHDAVKAPVSEMKELVLSRVAEEVHSTNEALDAFIPKFMKRFPEIAHESESARVQTIVNFLRTAKPQHFKALGLNGDDMQAHIAGGRLDAARLTAYLHQQGGASQSMPHAVAESAHQTVQAHIPSAEKVIPGPATATEGGHLAPLSHDDVVIMEKRWDDLTVLNRSELANRMVPDYIDRDIVSHLKGADPEHLMSALKDLPMRLLFADKESLAKTMDPGVADGVVALGKIVTERHLMNMEEGIDWEQPISTFVKEAYLKKLLSEGPTAFK